MKNILLIFGGDNVEREISVLTANQALNYLDKTKYNVVPCYIMGGALRTYGGVAWQTPSFFAKNKLKGESIICLANGCIKLLRRGIVCKKVKIDCALICAHGGSGENGGLQGMLELHNIPYTSCSVYSSAVCMDKWLSHSIMKNSNIRVCKTYKINKGEDINLAEIFEQLGGDAIVKPNSLGSSIGVGAATTIDELQDAINLAFIYDNEVLLQERVRDLVEYNCAAFKSSVGVVISEIESPITAKDVLNFEDKYLLSGKMSGLAREFPANIEASLKDKIKSTTMRVYTQLDMLGVVRIDYLYNRISKKLYLNEINTIPGSLAYYLFEGTGYSPERMLDEMINVAIDRYDCKASCVCNFNSCVLDARGCGVKGAKI